MKDPGSEETLGYRIAKAAYQQRPDVFHLRWISGETGLAMAQVEERVRRMYDEHLIMLAAAPAVQVYGQGLYYWFSKFKIDTLLGAKDHAALACENNDAIWNGYETSKAFDSVRAASAFTLDQLLWDVLLPELRNPLYEWIRVCPVARSLRSEHMNLWDAVDGRCGEYAWGANEPDALVNSQSAMDATDIRILMALNRKRPIAEYFDFSVLAELSGLEAGLLRAGMERVVETRQLLPVVYLNWQKLGLTQTVFAIRLRRDVALDRKSGIVDDFAAIPEFHTVWQFSDAHYDIGLMACTQTAGIRSLRRHIEETAEVDLVEEAEAYRQHRCWGCRLGDSSGMWEQCAAPGSGLSETHA
ncbi:MAG TPA: Lrp/AsnC family transcriptional regulator [Bryobacteraceae bacterium]|nr:Lrp/AsnC family transcriptional regulator [Bryobacteraceae bacterium]